MPSDKLNDNLLVIAWAIKKARTFKSQPVYAFIMQFLEEIYFPKYLSNKPFNALPCLASSLAIS